MASTQTVYNVPLTGGQYYSGPTDTIPTNTTAPTVYLSQSGVNQAGQTPTPMGPTQIFSGSTPLRTTDTAITSQSLAPQSAISLPSGGGSIGSAGSTGGTLAGNNAGLAGLLAPLGYTQDANGLFKYAAPVSTNANAQDPNSLDALMASLIPKQESVLQSPEIQQQNTQIQQKQQEVQSYTNQLNSIVAKANADSLSVTGQGRGIPEAIIGGQQAQINREAAIKALPIQALLSASQGDLAMAQDHLKQLVDIKTEEVQSTYQYKMNLYNSIKGYVDKKEAAQLSSLEKKATQENALQTNNLNYAQTLATSAFNNGQAQIGASLMKLMSNPASPTFMNDVASLAGQIQPKASGGSGTGGSSYKTYTYGGKVYTYQVDASGKSISAPVEAGTSGGSGAKGSMTSAQFVEKVLTSQKLSYNDVIAKIPSGRTGVIDNATGQIGSVLDSEYDPAIYTHL